MSENHNLVQAVLKALEIMEAMCRSQYSGVRDLSEKVGLNRSTVNRLVSTLEEAGYVEQEKERGKYRATLKIFELGNKVIRHLDIHEQAYPIMQKLSEETKETINLSFLDGNDVIFILQIDSPQMLKSAAPLGGRAPVYSNACGKAMLAFLPEVKNALLPEEFNLYTPNTIRNAEELEIELTRIRAKGYAVDNEEWCLNTKALAAPVWNCQGKVIAALAIIGPTVRMTSRRINELAPILVKKAKELSAKMGYRESLVYPP